MGAAAGACSRLFTTPVANVVTRRQMAGVSGQGQNQQGDSFWDAVEDIRREKGGTLGLWAGYSASLVLTLNPSITFFLQDALATTVAADGLDEDAGPGFLLAAVSKVVATAITYPFQTAKARLQVASSRSTEEPDGSDRGDEAMENKLAIGPGNNIVGKAHTIMSNNIFATILRIAEDEEREPSTMAWAVSC